jgi:hypothetical protein
MVDVHILTPSLGIMELGGQDMGYVALLIPRIP